MQTAILFCAWASVQSSLQERSHIIVRDSDIVDMYSNWGSWYSQKNFYMDHPKVAIKLCRLCHM